MPTSTLAQMAVLKARVSLPSRLRKTHATPLLSSTATIGKAGRLKCVKIALQVLPVALVVAVEGSPVATELVEVSADVVGSAGAVDTVVATVVATVGEEATAEEGLVEEPVVALTLLVHPPPRIRLRIMPLLEVNAVRLSTFAM